MLKAHTHTHRNQLYVERMDRTQQREYPQEMNPNAIQNEANGFRDRMGLYDLGLFNKDSDLQLDA